MIALASVSCSVFKGSEKRYLEAKVYNQEHDRSVDGEVVRDKIEYYVTTSEDGHCFKENPDNKEIFTVKSDYKEVAIDYFFEHKLKVKVFKNIHRNQPNGLPELKYEISDEVTPPIEVANCYLELIGFTTNFSEHYVSIRRKD